jgi:hypothetical protein
MEKKKRSAAGRVGRNRELFMLCFFSVQTGTVSGVILCWVFGEMRDDSRLHSWFLCAGSLEETREIYSKVSAL